MNMLYNQLFKIFSLVSFSSQRDAAAAYSIPRTTLTSRLKGSKNARIAAHEKQQRMTPLQEESGQLRRPAPWYFAVGIHRKA